MSSCLQYYQLEAGDTGRPILSQLQAAGSKLEEGLYFSTRYDAPLPGLLPDFFAGLMDFWLRIDEAGAFQFELSADDRIWMWVDGWRRNAAPLVNATDGAPTISGASQGCACRVPVCSLLAFIPNKQS